MMRNFSLAIAFLAHLSLQAQDSTINRKCLTNTIMVESAAYVTSTTALYFTWYQQYSTERFHFFNDWPEWNQMDKAGHLFTAYQLARLGYSTLEKCGVTPKQSYIYGAPLGWTYLLTIEVFDGFSNGWGFSWSDITANTAGMATFILQQALLNQQKAQVKYSFHPTKYASYRAELLGNNLPEQALKDYNGQTYWLSFSPFSQKSKWNFFQCSLGYGAEGMIEGVENSYPQPKNFQRYRQYYLSIDIDLTSIPVKKQWMKKILVAASWIKVPMPAIEWNTQNQFQFHWIYF